VEQPVVLVVRFSDAFEQIWPDLEGILGASVRVIAAAEVGVLGPDVAAVLLAAGGAERAAADWLESRQTRMAPPVVAVGADPSRRATALLMGAGASDYLVLPEDVELLHSSLAVLLTRFQVGRTVRHGDGNVVPGAFDAIITHSEVMRKVLARAGRMLRHADATALIVGETGTGKELLARAVHGGGPRRAAPFVPVNCSALPPHLVESELFGHERGAFTDAHAATPGLFEVAEGGTLFLDEIGALPLELQAKLLRVLENKEVRRVGGTRTRLADVRIIAATNAELERAIEDGSFRSDLYYRLSILTVSLPPLRERTEDLEPLAAHFLQALAREYGLPVPTLDAAAANALHAYDWPGNVRELKNTVERALLLAEPGHLAMEEFPARSRAAVEVRTSLPFPAALDTIEAAAAHAMLEVCEGNRSEAARRLRISRRRLRRLLGLNDSEV
jgi:DNA-binding NtrC family response regulator